ncbi:MAG: ribonuclease D [Magnetovibrionaceae bacterium]
MTDDTQQTGEAALNGDANKEDAPSSRKGRGNRRRRGGSKKGSSHPGAGAGSGVSSKPPAEGPLVTTNEALATLCDSLAQETFLTVDTEFLREKTFWPQVCLIQVGGTDLHAAIDPLADGLDLAPLYALFDNPDILKVFHAARQDLEIFYHLTGRLPAPVFDTQVAAMVCGFGDSVGYETLVNKLARQSIDKGPRFTDWSLRPLSDRQIDYALADVTHLRRIYDRLRERLESNGREGWLKAEMEILTSPETYAQAPEDAWRRLKSKSTNRRYLALLKEVCAWREREAQGRNVPRNRILRDESLTEIAHHAPRTPKELGRTRGLSEKAAEGSFGAGILAAVEAGLAVPDSDLPAAQGKEDLPSGIGPVTDLLKVVLKLTTEQAGVAQKLIASAADVERIAAFGEDANVPALKGWRREVFGEKALAVRDGRAWLGLEGRRLILREDS